MKIYTNSRRTLDEGAGITAARPEAAWQQLHPFPQACHSCGQRLVLVAHKRLWGDSTLPIGISVCCGGSPLRPSMDGKSAYITELHLIKRRN